MTRLAQSGNGESKQEDRFDQYDREFEMVGDRRFDSFVVGHRMTAPAKPEQDKSEIGHPTDKKRAHEPMAELEDMIDLESVLGGIGRLAEELVDEGQTIHTGPALPLPIPDAVRAASGNAAKDAN